MNYSIWAEKGFTLERCQELTGHELFSMAMVRDCFHKMTSQEQKQINTNCKNEVKETKNSIGKLLIIRREAYPCDKPVYTQKIKASKILLTGQEKRLKNCLII